MIRLTDVRKVYRTRFGSNVVLDGVGFEIHRGERLGLLGRNGAGKSTMVRLISGAERPTSGRIERTMSVSWPLAFGGAFQTMLTGVDNVRFISRVYNQDFDHNLTFVEDFSELGAYLREPVRTYSSGMRARLAFAISMIIEFDCFLIDEIGAVGDARFHDRCNQELFGKRGDRAMIIISHDAAYVRDHCNRFGVLHEGSLELYDDFEQAYGDFREQIGLTAAPRAGHSVAPGRSVMIEASQHRALQDERFRLLVMEGDWRRDAKAWHEAEEHYAAALALYPYQRSYWVQHGHVSKEGGRFQRAELSYRTACALGEPFQDVEEHIAFVMARQNVDQRRWPAPRYSKGAASAQAPGKPDLDLFGKMLWHRDPLGEGEMVDLLRRNGTCDELLSAMILDPRFAQANHAWLEDMRGDGRPAFDNPAGDNLAGAISPDHRNSAVDGRDVEWINTLCAIALPSPEAGLLQSVADRIRRGEGAWSVFFAADAFLDWPLAQAALRHLVPPQSRQ